jgi:hypothetical protein
MTMTDKQHPQKENAPDGAGAFPRSQSGKTTGGCQPPIAKDRNFESPAPNVAWRVALMNDKRLLAQLPADSHRRKPSLPKIGGRS